MAMTDLLRAKGQCKRRFNVRACHSGLIGAPRALICIYRHLLEHETMTSDLWGVQLLSEIPQLFERAAKTKRQKRCLSVNLIHLVFICLTGSNLIKSWSAVILYVINSSCILLVVCFVDIYSCENIFVSLDLYILKKDYAH